MAEPIIAVETYGAQQVKDPHTGRVISAYKLSYTSAVTAVLLTLYGENAHDLSPKRASYRYVRIDGELVVQRGHILLTLTADQLAKAEAITRASYRAGVFLWREQQWWALPDSTHAEYTEPGDRSGPSFDPTGFRPPSPSSGERKTTVSGILAERSQRSAQEKPWWWLSGETYPHRNLLKQHSARFSARRKQWYWIGAELPAAIQALVSTVSPPDMPASVQRAEPQRPNPNARAADPTTVHTAPQSSADTTSGANAETSADQPPPAIRITPPLPFPADGEPLDNFQRAIHEASSAVPDSHSSPYAPAAHFGRAVPIPQAYCGELTGSITGQVFCYGWAVFDGVCVYLNLGGPRMSVEAIRAKLSKGDSVTVVPDDAPALELTAGEGNSGVYHAYLHTVPEARFTSLILLHDWLVHPNYEGAATTFILKTSDEQAQAKLKQHITQLVKLPLFEGWTPFLWTAGQTAMLVYPTHSKGGIDLLTISLDATAWTRLITSGLAQGVIALPDTG